MSTNDDAAAQNSAEVYRRGLRDVSSRKDTLEHLLTVSVATREALLPELMDLASGTHVNVPLVRDVLASLPIEKERSRFESLAEANIKKYGQEAAERYLELYAEIDEVSLQRLCVRLLQDADPALRELAEPYRDEADVTD